MNETWKMCFAHRRGRCKFGPACRYTHAPRVPVDLVFLVDASLISDASSCLAHMKSCICGESEIDTVTILSFADFTTHHFDRIPAFAVEYDSISASTSTSESPSEHLFTNITACIRGIPSSPETVKFVVVVVPGNNTNVIESEYRACRAAIAKPGLANFCFNLITTGEADEATSLLCSPRHAHLFEAKDGHMGHAFGRVILGMKRYLWAVSGRALRQQVTTQAFMSIGSYGPIP